MLILIDIMCLSNVLTFLESVSQATFHAFSIQYIVTPLYTNCIRCLLRVVENPFAM